MSAAKRRARRYTDLELVDAIAIIYRRVSKDEMARDGLSFARQLDECRAYIARAAPRGWTAGEEYDDTLSGRKDQRPGYQSLLQRVRGYRLAGRNVVIVVQDFDRLGRNIAERVRCWEELTELGVEIHSIRHNGVVTEVIYNITATIAQEESRKIGERQWGIIRGLEERGWHKSGSAPWGYVWRERTPDEQALGAPKSVMVLDDATAPAVRTAFTMRADGDSIRTVAAWAATLPESERGGRTLNFAAVRKILATPVYIARFGTLAEDDERGPILARPRARWEPLIADEVFARCLERDAEHVRMPRQASGAYALTGLLRCAVCGCRMGGRPRHAQRGYTRTREYFCSSSQLGAKTAGVPRCYATVGADVIERAVIEPARQLVAIAADVRVHDLIRRAQQRAERAEAGTDPAARRSRLERELDETRAALGKASAEWLKGGLDREAYDAARAYLQTDRAKIEAELSTIRMQRTAESPLDDIAALLSAMHGWSAAFEHADPLALRSALGTLIEHVEPVRIRRGEYAAAIKYTPIGLRLLALRREVADLQGDEAWLAESVETRSDADVVCRVDHSASVGWSTCHTRGAA